MTNNADLQTIVFATGNAHKAEEVSMILDGSNIVLKSLKDIGWSTEIVEDGDTFHANALIKAKAIYEAGHPNVISEDSGIVVDALDGAPGIYSARYAGEGKQAVDNNALLLKNLAGQSIRSAYYMAVICLIIDGEVHFFEGKWEGTIVNETSAGTGGFGYDPLFIPSGYQQTVAELPATVKTNQSHRSKAFTAFKAYWQQRYQ